MNVLIKTLMLPVAGIFAAASATSCASTSAASDTSTDGANTSVSAEFGDGPIPTSTAPAAVVSSGPASGQRTGDGIDDENWLPRKDTAAYRAFVDAAETARRDPRAAVGKFVDAARASPGFYAAWYNAGASAEASGDVAAAEQHYREAIKVRPDYGPALVNLTSLLTRTGREAEATRVIADALRAAPTKAGPHLANAHHSFRTRDLVTAEREARAAIEADERNVPAMLIMAQVFRGEGRLDTARFAIDNALALEPGNALLHVERGQILLGLKERKEALIAFERAARLRPGLAEAIEPYGRLLLENGMASEARPVLETLVKLEPDNPRAYLLMGNALRATKEYPQAEAAYIKALALDPNLGDAHFNLGVLYIDNVLPGTDELVRLGKGLGSLKKYQASGVGDGATKARLADYIDSTEKRISREAKKREREQKRQTDEAAKPAPTAAPAATTAPAGGAPPAPAGGAG